MANDKKKKRPWPVISQVRETTWVPHPNKPGWEINVLDMNERKAKPKKQKK